MNLTAEKMHKVFTECLFKEGEKTDVATIGEGIMMNIGFNPERLAENESKIIAMLEDLPDEFKSSKGGGWSFLNMCNTKEGNQWADLHQTMDELVCLGNAIGKMNFLMPREMWAMFPGGMPYIVINQSKTSPKEGK